MTGRSGRTAVVVGSGPNGLTAAALLTRRGYRVDVLEAADSYGGGTRTAELTLPGFRHDVCAAVHPLGIASPVFRDLRLGDHGVEWLQPPFPLAHPLDEGPAVLLHRSLAETADGLGADGERWNRLVGPLVRSFDAIVDHVLGPPVRLPARPLPVARFGLSGVQSARRVAGRFLYAPARALLAGCAAHSIAPLQRPATAAIGLLLAAAAHHRGWPVARGGSQAIADALAAIVIGQGGSIRTGHRVASPDDLPAAEVYLFDVAPRTLAQIAGDRFPPRYRRRLERWRHGPGSFKIDWALAGPIPWRDPAVAGAGTVHLGGTFEEIAAAEAAVVRGEHPDRPFVLLSQPGVVDPDRAPPGRHVAWGYCHVPAGSTRDMTSAIEAQVERFAPGFGELVLQRHTLTATDLEAGNANYVGGDIGGGAFRLRSLLFRPRLRRPYSTPDPDIFLVSASTPPGAGVHGMCGFHGVRAIDRRR